jgi:phosphatidylinositol dimannoside acyltransferase
MDLRNLFNSAEALRFGHWLGRHIPLNMGLRLADGATRALARRRESALMQTLQNNFRVALGPDASEERVYQTARAALRHAGMAYFDLYHALGVGPEAFLSEVRSTPLTDYYIDRMLYDGRGVVVVTVHMSNFDLAGLAFAYRGLQLNVLAYADPTSGYDMQNKIRLKGGINLMPIDVSALRKSLEALRRGQLVVTGIDRPDPFGGGEMLPFFGQAARLPVGHVRLALQTGAPVAIAHCEYRPTDHSYAVHVSRWLEMERVGTRQEDIVHNACRVLAVGEELIAAKPEQWLMFYPVWGEGAAEGDHPAGAPR